MQIHPRDNVEVNLSDGHKYALRDIAEGERIIKYGFPIGIASAPIRRGEHVHTNNLKTALGDLLSYEYHPEPIPKTEPQSGEIPCFEGYLRGNGDVGIRNDVWIINTVGCVNKTAQRLAELTGALYFPHPFGCSQLGDDHALTQKILKGLVNHPNAGGVLVLGLGCENNNIPAFQKVLGDYDSDRVKFLITQETEDEIEEGKRLIAQLRQYADRQKRQSIPVSRLRVGLKCGGSDGYSGITANPLVGRFSDRLIGLGGSTVLSEVPEMFGAETILMNRCKDKATFDKTVALINHFKEYFLRHGQVVYENPSPGNKAGGITTLEEKSLGCVQKGGRSAVVDVLDYGETVQECGLNLLNGPGNDIVAVTNLTAAGAHLILFTTGRGTPLGAPVPTVKIATNPSLAKRKANWIDFNAGRLLTGEDSDALDEEFFRCILRIASGEQTKNEENGYREISIFKDGVTL